MFFFEKLIYLYSQFAVTDAFKQLKEIIALHLTNPKCNHIKKVLITQKRC